MIRLRLNNWVLSAAVFASPTQQYDNGVEVRCSGDFPDGYTFELLILHEDFMDVVHLDRDGDELTASLTAEQLAFDGEYTLQLRGFDDYAVKHSTQTELPIGRTISGDEQWPEVPTVFTQTLGRAEEALEHAESIIEDGVTPLGEWNEEAAYDRLDVVSHDAGSYMARQDVPAGTALTEAAYWMTLANTAEAIARWLEAHPEATNTVQDGSITRQKLAAMLANEITKHGTDIDVLDSRVDEIMELTPGSTTGDAQLADIKIGWDGRTYAAPGNAVRGQVGDINRQISDFVIGTVFESGNIVVADGRNATNTKRIRTKYYISDDVDRIVATGGMQFNIFAYGADESYVGAWNADLQRFDTSAIWLESVDVRVLRDAASNAYMFRVSARKSTDADISSGEVVGCGANILMYRSRMADADEPSTIGIRDILQYTGSLIEMPDGAEWTLGHLITASGVDRSSDPTDPSYGDDAKYYATTDYYTPMFRRVYSLSPIVDSDGIPTVTFVHEYDYGKRWKRRTRLDSGGHIDLADNTGFIRLVFGHASKYNTQITSSYLSLVKIYGAVKLPVDDIIRSTAYTWELKQGINATGNDIASNTYSRTDFISPTARGYAYSGKYVIHKTVGGDADYDAVCYLHEYDENKVWIQRSLITMTPALLTNRTAYIRFVFGRTKATIKTAGSATVGEVGAFAVTPLAESEIRNQFSGKASDGNTMDWGTANFLANAQQMYSIKYTPIRDMPTQHSMEVFQAGVEVTGLPYSSARAYNKMIGIDVSFHTFMSAISNPRSVLYTRKLRTRNAGTFYGVVCSVFDDYAMGFPFNVTTAFFREWDILERHPYTAIEVGDFLVNNTHTILITGLIRDTYGRIDSVTYAQATPPVVYVTASEPWDTFRKSREGGSNPYGVYRYPKKADVQYTPSPYVQCFDENAPEEDIVFPDIMSEYGDHAVLLEGESTKINVLTTDGYTNIVVKNGETTVLETTTLSDFTLDALAAGNYDIIITDTPADPDADGAKTSHSYLHVVGCACTFDEGTKEITFSSYGDAVPVTVNYSCGYYYGTPRRYDVINEIKILTGTDIEDGHINVADLDPQPNPAYTVHGDIDYWASVIFQTPHGSATWRSKPFDGVWDASLGRYDPMPVQYEVTHD